MLELGRPAFDWEIGWLGALRILPYITPTWRYPSARLGAQLISPQQPGTRAKRKMAALHGGRPRRRFGRAGKIVSILAHD